MISIVTPCYNEQENVDELCQRVRDVMATLPYRYEHICIDNRSVDQTVPRLKEIARRDPNLKIIVNARNFGHIRSPFHGLLQAKTPSPASSSWFVSPTGPGRIVGMPNCLSARSA